MSGKLSIGDLKSESGLKNLDQYLESRSYIEGWVDRTYSETNLWQHLNCISVTLRPNRMSFCLRHCLQPTLSTDIWADGIITSRVTTPTNAKGLDNTSKLTLNTIFLTINWFRLIGLREWRRVYLISVSPLAETRNPQPLITTTTSNSSDQTMRWSVASFLM